MSTISSSHARVALLLGAALCVVTPALAQNAAFDAAQTNATTAPLQAALAADGTPLTFAASALDASWRRFKIGKSLDNNFSDDGESYSYLTRGETLSVGAETFLMAYRARYFSPDGSDFGEVIENSVSADVATNATDSADSATVVDSSEYFGDSEPTSDGYARLLPAQTLQLCLLNVRNVDGLGDIRAFDAKTDLIQIVTDADRKRISEENIAARASLDPQAARQTVDSDLKQIGLALRQYVQDYDEKLPSMRSAQSMAEIKEAVNRRWDDPRSTKVQQVLYPYIKNAEVFAHPITDEIYRPNINISRRSYDSFASPVEVIAFYEASPASDGRRAVLYLDGHVRREPEADWPRIRAASDAIAPPLNFGKRSVTSGMATATTVTLYDAAAMAYMLRRQRDDKGRPQQVYLSKSTGRVYYRDAQTKQAIWLSSSTGTTARGITIPASQAQEFREFQGYNRRTDGRRFGSREPDTIDESAAGSSLGSNYSDMMVYVPKVKTAIGADAAMMGSMIDVDGLGDKNLIVLRGTTTTRAQKDLAEAIARRNAVGVTIENQLVVK